MSGFTKEFCCLHSLIRGLSYQISILTNQVLTFWFNRWFKVRIFLVILKVSLGIMFTTTKHRSWSCFTICYVLAGITELLRKCISNPIGIVLIIKFFYSGNWSLLTLNCTLFSLRGWVSLVFEEFTWLAQKKAKSCWGCNWVWKKKNGS